MPRLAGVVLALLLGAGGCAQGVPTEDDGATVIDATVVDATSDDLGSDVGRADVPGAFDRPATADVVRVDASRDAPTVDEPVIDVPVAIDMPAAVDVPPAIDMPPPIDVPVDTGPTGPVACTPATAAALCGARPCVDGYCCDAPCGGSCQSCALAGSQGRCTSYPSATDPEAECPEQAASTCGTTGSCNGAGACARHPAGTPCDDRASCTTADTCDGAGTCRGAAPAMCAPGAGNECCLGSCDPTMGCRTAAGLCADQCSATRLRTGRMCQGCGAAGAVGACGGGGDFACDAGSHSLCQAIPCGGQTFYCTNDGGVWQWRTGTRCDDGNACTHTDACGAGTCRGTAITCTSDACMTRACAGTATCTQTPRPGVACDDGNATTNSDVCSSAGVCVGTVVCGLPANACSDGAESRDDCAGARVVGRRAAATAAGYTATGSTCTARNRFDDCSWDANYDHTYRIWARAGETMTVNLTRGAGCETATWRATLKVYQGNDCGTVTCTRGQDRWCEEFVTTRDYTYVAPRDGWIVVVVDGSTITSPDRGAYTLRVRLTGCREGTCECP